MVKNNDYDIFLLHSFNQPYSFTLSLSIYLSIYLSLYLSSSTNFITHNPKIEQPKKSKRSCTTLHNPPYTFRKSYTIRKPYTFSIELYTHAFRTHFLIFFPPSLKKMEQFEDPSMVSIHGTANPSSISTFITLSRALRKA